MKEGEKGSGKIKGAAQRRTKGKGVYSRSVAAAASRQP